MRSVLLVCAAFLAALSLVPIGAAQTTPTLSFVFKSPHDNMPLPESGKRSHTITVEVTADDFVCLQPGDYAVEIGLGEFDKWAGASMNPRLVKFRIDQAKPGTDPWIPPSQAVVLEVAWDLEGRPKKNAEFTYEVKFLPETFKREGGGPCAPDPTPHFGDPVKVKATMPDIVENDTAKPTDCAVAPDLPECQVATVAPEADSPGFDALFLALAVVGVVVAARRRR